MEVPSMRIGVLGTGVVARAHAARIVEQGHKAMMGTRDPENTLARSEPDSRGNEPFSAWQRANPDVRLGSFVEAASFGEMVINATLGSASLEALALAGAANLAGKILMDISNPLDFSRGMPPGLFVSNTDSLGEQIQRSFPEARVVKTLNTVSAPLQVNPVLLATGRHHAFLSGNDPVAKVEVARFLQDVYGWQQLIDLGDITTARGPEMMMPIWLRLRLNVLKTPFFNFTVVGYEQEP
jgi:8-hydroxy-5-deazaflavin:NADPH oxidoreductase